jgi:signal transduction histidine kinase
MGSGVSPRLSRVDRDLQAIGAVTQAVLDGEDLEQLLGRIAREARILAAGISGVVVTVAPETGLMTFRGVDGLSVGPLRVGHVMPVAGTLTELALARGGNLVVSDPEEIPPAGRAFAIATGTGPLVAAPLASIGPVRGVLLVARTAAAAAFSRADIALVSTFAAQAASAIQLFDLRTAERGVAAQSERRRVASDLHHGVIGALADLQAGIRGLASGADRELKDGIARASVELDEAMAATAAYVVELEATGDPAERAIAQPTADQPAVHAPVRAGSARAPARHESRGSTPIGVLGDLARAAFDEAATANVLDRLAMEVMVRAGATAVLIGSLSEAGDAIVVRSRAGAELPGRGRGDVLPIEETGAREAIGHGGPLVADEAASIVPGVPQVVRDRVGPTVVAPLAIRGRRFGAMAISRGPDAAPFSRAEIGLIEAYSTQAAIVLEFERVRNELRRGSVAIERDRIGRDVHDRVVRVLFGVSFALQALESTVNDDAVRASLQAAVEGLDRTIRDLRRVVFGLAPGPGAAAPLADRIEVLAADNARLQSEIEAQLEEVRASRVRIIAAGDAERKRVERDLHDGAQQRLVSLTLALRLARSRLGDDLDPSAKLSLDQASDDAKAALSELRELARGIHPQILTEAGLGPAVQSLADRSSVAVRVDIGELRFAPVVEGAAYFTISEALANVSKYAQAREALVRTRSHGDDLVVEITDDGIGGADPSTGTGLRGLADRLASVNGSLEINSPVGGGTHLLARIPLAAAGVPAA